MSPGPDKTDPVAQGVDVPPPNGRFPWRERWQGQGRVLAAVSLGGMLGASARYAAERAWPTDAGAWPWATFAVNVTGCALIGMLMVHVVESGQAHPLARPFLGVGLLGGFTTFSTYAVQSDALLRHGQPALATAYLAGTLAAALAAVVAGIVVARGVTRLRHRALQRGKGER